MADMSRTSRQMSWHGQPRRVSVLAEMALRQEKVSERLLQLREREGLSQEDAARRVGITHRQWQRWESGSSMPYPRSLDAVASAFGISVSDFFDQPTTPRVDGSQLDRLEKKVDELLSLVRGALEIRAPELLQQLADAELAAATAPAQGSPTGRPKRTRRAS